MSWLLDTCVVSELSKPTPHSAVHAWIEKRREEDIYLSVLTLGELLKGLGKLAPSHRRTQLETWVKNDLVTRFQGRLLPVDEGVAARWGAILGASESRGRPLPVIDALIAATALQRDLVVVTRNVADLEACGARCWDPWQQRSTDR